MINDIKTKKRILELMDGIVFLPLHLNNVVRVENVKRVWRGKNIINIKNN